MTNDFNRWSDDDLEEWLRQAREEYEFRHPPRRDAIIGSVCVSSREIEECSDYGIGELMRVKCNQLFESLMRLIKERKAGTI